MLTHSHRVPTVLIALGLSSAAPLSAQIIREPISKVATVYTGPPPANFHVTGSTPTSASMAWDATAGAMTYSVMRTTGTGNPWTTLTPTPLPASMLSFTDNTGIDYRTTYTYRLYVNYSAPPAGSADLSVTLAKPVNPAGLTAKQTGDGTVSLSWTGVPGVTSYTVFGQGLPGGAITVSSPSVIVTGLPVGPQTWTVASVYQPGNITTPGTEFPSISTTVERWTGNYRVTLLGFTDQSATTDDAAGADGVGDEILPMVFWQRFQDPNAPRLADQQFARASVHGDNGKSYRTRVRAGSGQPSGGILSNDIVPAGFTTAGSSGGGSGAMTATSTATCGKCSSTQVPLPIVVWQGQLTRNNDVLVLYPSLWEVDEQPAVFRTPYEQAIANRAADVMNNPSVRAALDQPGISEVRGSLALQMFSHGPFAPADRPIGVEAVPGKLGGSDAGFFDRIIVLSLKKIEDALNAPPKYPGMPAGTIGLSFFEPGVIWVPSPDAYNFSGQYVLYLNVQRY